MWPAESLIGMKPIKFEKEPSMRITCVALVLILVAFPSVAFPQTNVANAKKPQSDKPHWITSKVGMRETQSAWNVRYIRNWQKELFVPTHKTIKAGLIR